jgi:hypothetical protein
MSNKLTIQDSARLAGVSKATVARVLNHYPSVNSLLRERVQRVVLVFLGLSRLVCNAISILFLQYYKQ